MQIYIVALLAILLVLILIVLVILLKPKKNYDLEIRKAILELNKNINESLYNSSNNIIDRIDVRSLRESLTNDFSFFTEKMSKQFENNRVNMYKELHNSIKEITNDFINFEANLTKRIETKMNQIDDKVDLRLQSGFKETNETFKDIVKRISKIDEAQRNIEKLSSEVISLQDILSDKKSRGTFGEIELKQLLVAVYGENNSKIYEIQKKLPNDMIADCVLYTPSPLGMICIDSKFPLENFRNMLNKSLSEEERKDYSKKFKIDIKKHIDDIKNKYIITGVTANQACMFLPSEAVFAEINAYYPELVDYSYKANVWITSPTTLMAFLTTIQLTLQNIEKSKYAKVIHQELEKLSLEFDRYKQRWDKLKKDIDSVSKDVGEIHTTTTKISSKFERINNADVEKLE